MSQLALSIQQDTINLLEFDAGGGVLLNLESPSTDLIEVVSAGPQGPSSATLKLGASLDLTAAATTVLHTASQTEVITGVMMRTSTAPTGTVSIPTLNFQRSDGVAFNFPQQITGIDVAGYGRFLPFAGRVPTLSSGQTFNAVVSIPSTADTWQIAVDVFGYRA